MLHHLLRCFCVHIFVVLRQNANVLYLSEAFQRARRKMKEAQENLPKDLISSTSQLQIELSSQLRTM